MWSGRRDSNPRPSPWQGMSTYFAELRKHTETASGLLFQLITGSRCFATSRGLYAACQNGLVLEDRWKRPQEL